MTVCRNRLIRDDRCEPGAHGQRAMKNNSGWRDVDGGVGQDKIHILWWRIGRAWKGRVQELIQEIAEETLALNMFSTSCS